MVCISKEPFTKKQVHDEVEEIEMEQQDRQISDELRERSVESKIHPVLKNIIAEKQADINDKKEQIIINFRDDLVLPRFPEPNLNESRKSSYNKKSQNTRKN